jgi:cyclophilin family peptidyl-prolyl cis-trans isomerase
MIYLVILASLIGFALAPATLAEAQTARKVAVFETTQGNFKVELYDDLAPKTAGNFESLVEKKFYDGTVFHRIIDGFMIQGGDPEGTGRGGPGYEIDDEFGPGLVHEGPGVLSMANAGPNTGGSQFFITLAATPWLDQKHAIFGHVVEGQDVVEAIGKVETARGDRPVTEITVQRIYLED